MSQRLLRLLPNSAAAAAAAAASRASPTTAAVSTASKRVFFSVKAADMGVERIIRQEGNGPSPEKGQKVTMEYTGWLKDTSKQDQKGKQFDSSVGRGDFVTAIGVGQVIKGWDVGVAEMKLGEKATLFISSDYAYGSQEFPGLIPPHSDLIFDVELKKIS